MGAHEEGEKQFDFLKRTENSVCSDLVKPDSCDVRTIYPG